MLTKKRAVLTFTAVAAMTLSMAACGTGGTGGDGGGSNDSASVWYVSGAPKETLWKDQFAAWNQANPDQQIKAEVYANDAYKEKIRTAIGAGNAPTLVFSWGAYGPVAEYVSANQIISLEGKVDEALSRTLDSVDAAGVLDGVQYAVPNGDTQPVMLFYNKDLFDQAGVVAPITTWEDLLASIPKFKAIGVAPFALAGQSKWPDLMWLEYLADRVGGPQTFNDVVAGKEGAWSSPEMIQALTYIQDLVKADGFQESFGSTTADSNADVALVHTGKAAMILQGSWAYGSFKNDAPEFVSAGKLGSFPFPSVPGGKGDQADIAGNPSNYWSISSTASAAAQEIALKWLNEENLDAEYVDGLIAGGAIPPVEGIRDKLAASDDGEFLTAAYDLVLNAPNFQSSWDQVLSSVAAQEMLTNLDKIFNGQITPQEFAANMDKTINQ
ncbi:MAG: extracellular solute-binding protein [Bifidobacteriaceae bacterium]|jgi:raffinose/stachyose/melibiose transport system substrate-binding protein|nr:extracellular solute-binding protein [Bifidobacteriaceae bacterium]